MHCCEAVGDLLLFLEAATDDFLTPLAAMLRPFSKYCDWLIAILFYLAILNCDPVLSAFAVAFACLLIPATASLFIWTKFFVCGLFAFKPDVVPKAIPPA